MISPRHARGNEPPLDGSPRPQEFCPDNVIARYLLSELIPKSRVHITGNTVVDALLWVPGRQGRLDEQPIARATCCGMTPAFADRYFLGQNPTVAPWILVTGHRRESFGTNDGRIHIEELDLDVLVRAAVQSGKMRAAIAPAPAEVYIIAVPTLFKPTEKSPRAPDLSYVEAETRSLAAVIESGALVVRESNSPTVVT